MKFCSSNERYERATSVGVIAECIGLMGVLIAVVISIGGLVEIVPLYMQRSVIQPSPGVEPYSALALGTRIIPSSVLTNTIGLTPAADEPVRRVTSPWTMFRP